MSTVPETSGRFRTEPRERWFWELRGGFHEHNLRMSELTTALEVLDYYTEHCAEMYRELVPACGCMAARRLGAAHRRGSRARLSMSLPLVPAAALNMVFAANRVCVLDTGGDNGADLEPVFAGIDK